MPAQGGTARRLTTSPAGDSDPCWSPDGGEIAFASNREGNDDIWVVPVSGGRPRALTSHPSSDWHPDWSPDGEWIIFTSARNSLYGEIWRVPAAGGEAELLTEGGYHPRYAPDGAHAYFKGSGERGDIIWEYSFQDRGQRPVMDISGREGFAYCTGTDGRYLYLIWSEDIRGDIWVMDVD
jgi:tricorn protease